MPEIKDVNEEIRRKRVIIFDLDRTLAVSKTPIDEEMAEILLRLLKKYRISIISGGKLEQLIESVVSRLKVSEEELSSLYLQPTSGAALYLWKEGEWDEIYIEEISKKDREIIKKTLEESIALSEVEIPEESYGDRIEDRGSQVTFSALGQKAPVELKRVWDPQGEKRKNIQEILEPKIPKYEVSIGGSSSIDIIRKNFNKGYGVNRLSKEIGIPIKEMLFIGDRLEPGGNDHSVTETGIDWIDVSKISETKVILNKLLG